MPTVLQVLAQRPALTGSGITIDALARQVTLAGWDQHVVVAAPADGLSPVVDGLPDERIHALRFGTDALPFPVPGMSDVMPYPSTVFGAMTDAEWDAYEAAWRSHLRATIERTRPALIHVHHAWFVAALLRELAPDIPLVVHCHGTCLRQLMRAQPDRAAWIRDRCRDADAFVVLHDDHVDTLVDLIGVSRDIVHVVGAGFAPEQFHARGRAPEPWSVLYAGKLAYAKGLDVLLSAAERLAGRDRRFRLHVAGDGTGDEADRLRERMSGLAPTVVYHGRLAPERLAERMRRAAVFALPSFYEGLPLVLVEARACGCRLVATALPGVESLVGALDTGIELVAMPRVDVDRPDPDDLPAFVMRLTRALEQALTAPPEPPAPHALDAFTWAAVFARIEAVWTHVLGARRAR